MSQLDWDIKDIFMAKGMVSARMTPRIVFNLGGGPGLLTRLMPFVF
ncbi:MAG: hypothetical protein HUN05_22485 [Desulfobacter sp.]|nr:MAG: hypothetical protein HUN05_22485 [Desulfobacter sp.]